MRYPIGVQTFEEMINRNYVYVDKTDLVYTLAQSHICFLSRPRRFGKSLLISTLEAYFSGKKELFKELKIEKLENDWEEHPVFRIDFARGDYSEPGELKKILEEQICDWEKEFGKDETTTTLSGRFLKLLGTAHEKTGHKPVVLIDEYDKPMLDVLGTEQEQRNRETLKGFYGTFKAADEHLRFVFLTGVTKFSQVSVFSGFNQPEDISMDRRYDAICGITEEELYSYFAEPMSEMADRMEYTTDEMKRVLKKQYDGYHFSNNLNVDIYNPFSIINAFNKMDIEDYWYKSGTPTYLAKLLDGHNINMQKLTANEYKSKYFVDYRADSESPLAMLYQSGYLTIKGYDKYDKVYRLDYPNDEVRSGFGTLIANSYFRKDNEVFVMSVKEKINNLKCFTDLHIHIDGSVSVKSARELAVIENITLPEEDEQLKNMLMVSDDCHDLNEYLEKFTLPVSLMQSKESLKKCAYNLCTELMENGLMYAELRFAPQKHCEKGLSQEEVVQAVLDGIKSSGFPAGLILCCMRDGSDNEKENLETIHLTEKYLGNGVCACDLAGAEALFPNERYDYFFRTLNQLKVPFTVHSGEALGAESVRYAIENGAFRIGHGVRSVEDEEVVSLVIKKDIPLEICPTSNINTCVFEKISDMPVAELLSKGVKVTVNTDNTSVSSTDIKREYIKISEAFGFDLDKIKIIIQNSVKSSFADDEMKKKMFEIIDREFEN